MLTLTLSMTLVGDWGHSPLGPAIVPADFPSLQFRNELSSLTVQALGLVWSNKCSHCCANLLFILRCNPASSKKKPWAQPQQLQGTQWIPLRSCVERSPDTLVDPPHREGHELLHQDRDGGVQSILISLTWQALLWCTPHHLHFFPPCCLSHRWSPSSPGFWLGPRAWLLSCLYVHLPRTCSRAVLTDWTSLSPFPPGE